MKFLTEAESKKLDTIEIAAQVALKSKSGIMPDAVQFLFSIIHRHHE